MLSTVPPLILWAIPLFVLAMLIEGVESYRDEAPAYADRRDTQASLSMGIGYVLISLVWKGLAFAAYTTLWNLRLFDIGWSAAAWVAMFFADDLAYYAFHRAHHEIRLLWASHVPHHSSERYNLSTALRQTWTPFTGWVFWAPLAIIGFHPIMLVTAQSINLLYQFWIHTERIDKLHPAFEFVFNTPSHHRVHHGSNPQYLDRNYAGILIIWDRLFGTFEPEVEKVVYGLTKNVGTYNPLTIAFHEFRAIGRDLAQRAPLGDRLRYVFAGPGWAAARNLATTSSVSGSGSESS